MADIEDTLRGQKRDLELSIYKDIDDIVNNIEVKEKDLKHQYEEEKQYFSSTNKSMISAFSPDVPLGHGHDQRKKLQKKEKEQSGKYRKYRPTQDLKENDLYNEMGSLMDESLQTSGRSTGNQTVG
jgi:hypothetical protein